VVVYPTDKTQPNAEMIRFQSIDTGETRPTCAGIVEWLEEKARCGVKEALQLVIESEIKIEP